MKMRGEKMKHGKRQIYFDRELETEVYWFHGIMQKFPNHFHEYYVIGFVENGQRRLYCKNKDYIINPGDMVVLNPFDSHTCLQVNDEALDWRCINIKKEIMEKAVKELCNEEYLPYFLLLAFSEAWLSGGVLTVFVIYRPHWVGSFDDAHYIFHK